MSDVHLDEEGTELERELLASWKTMTAPEDARKKALGVLTVGATAVVATQAAVAASAGGKAAVAKSAGVLAKVFGKIVAKVSAGLNLGAGASVAAPVATGIVAKTVIASAIVATTVVGVEVGAPIVREKLEHRAVSGVVVAPPPANVAPAVDPKSNPLPKEDEAPPPADDLVVEDDLAPQEAVVPEPAVPPSSDAPAVEEQRTAAATKGVVGARKLDAPKETSKPARGALETSAPQAAGTASTDDATTKKKASKTPSASSDLTDALRAIKSGRKALDDRNPTAAIEYLTVIGNDSPLAAEAMALRFDAYTRAGNKEAARYVAKKLVASFPDSPYASRMQRALEEEE